MVGMGAMGCGRCDEFEEDDGTCWKARVTSYADILAHGPEPEGGGVSPPSDLTSCSEKGTPVRSSAMPLSELMGCMCALSGVCDHTAFKCSGSGARAGDSLIAITLGEFDHGDCADPACGA